MLYLRPLDVEETGENWQLLDFRFYIIKMQSSLTITNNLFIVSLPSLLSKGCTNHEE